MSPVSLAEPDMLSDLLQRLGQISPDRVPALPHPGSATEQDLFEYQRRYGRSCELVDGTLVEKAMGFKESFLAAELLAILVTFVKAQNLGLVTGEQGLIRLFPGIIRIPNIAFFPWERLPGRVAPQVSVADFAPALVVEVLSPGNCTEEMQRKRKEYFRAGVLLIWEIDPEARTVAVYTAPDKANTLREGCVLSGGNALPGFSLSLIDLFEVLGRRQTP